MPSSTSLVPSELPERGLVIRQPWIDRILIGDKKWELRGKSTQVRGEIALIQGGSCTIVGIARIVNVLGPLTQTELEQAAKAQNIGSDEAQSMNYPKTYAWVLDEVRPLAKPAPYRHPRGAIIWVRLEGAVDSPVISYSATAPRAAE